MAYVIERECSGCGMCAEMCPVACIEERTPPFVIDAKRCVSCGVCADACPIKVIHAQIAVCSEPDANP